VTGEAARRKKAETEALARIRDLGALVRHPGGFWTYEGCGANRGVPTWFVGIRVIRSLEARGLIVVDDAAGRATLAPVEAS
jgi:hypothetical protein